MDKIRYELDPHNRLVIRKTGARSRLWFFRRVLDGRFRIDKNNMLTYHVKEPTTQGPDTPHQVRLQGRWSLTRNHDLRFTLDKWRRQTFGDQLTLQGEILDVNKHALLFSVTTRSQDGTESIYALKLEGRWQADKNNRLTFRVNRSPRRQDALVFDGIWEKDKNHRIVYRYEKKQQARGVKEVQSLIFKGYWDINAKNRVSYVMDRDSESGFDFRVGAGIFRGKVITYEVKVGLTNRKTPRRNTLVFTGTWNLDKNKGLVFELDHAQQKAQRIMLGGRAKLTDAQEIVFKLQDRRGRDLGAELQLSHKLLRQNGEAFLRLLKYKKEVAVYAGAGLGW